MARMGVTLMGFSPAHIKRCTLTWEAPDYSASYPAGYTDQGVAVIAVAQEHRTAQGFAIQPCRRWFYF